MAFKKGRKHMFHILVTDDDKNTRLLLKAVLESDGYTVYVAANGEEALTVMDKQQCRQGWKSEVRAHSAHR